MANKAQLEILKAGVEAWNKWREDNSDEFVDLLRAAVATRPTRFDPWSEISTADCITDRVWTGDRRREHPAEVLDPEGEIRVSLAELAQTASKLADVRPPIGPAAGILDHSDRSARKRPVPGLFDRSSDARGSPLFFLTVRNDFGQTFVTG